MPRLDLRLVDVPALLASLGIEAKHDGNRWLAPCPFPGHKEKEPSWDMRDDPGHPRHGLQGCFGCKEGGNAVQLVMGVMGTSYASASSWVEEHGMGKPVPSLHARLEIAPTTKRNFRLPPEVRIEHPNEWVGPAKKYLVTRHIPEHQAARWGLGYAVEGRLAGRIVVPVRNDKGMLRSYTARTYVGDPKRYIEPRREEGPDPSAIFGEEHWPDTANRFAVGVTEGAFNGLAFERCAYGVPFASLQGSQVTAVHVMKLATFTRALVLTDPDPAGDRAWERLHQALARHIDMVRVIIPSGTDADALGPKLTDYLEPHLT